MKTFLLVLVTIVWGSTFLIVKDTVGTVNEYLIVFIRSALAFSAMLIYQLHRDWKKLVNKKSFYYGSIMGILMAITYGAQTIGLKYTSTGHSAFTCFVHWDTLFRFSSRVIFSALQWVVKF